MTSSEIFSNRIVAHPRISDYQRTPTDPRVLAVQNQLLVCGSASATVKGLLQGVGVHTQRTITTLLNGLAPPPGTEDVEIWEIGLPAGQDIFDVTAALRTALGHQKRMVSPNHVLVPAPEWHSCPFGPPSPWDPGAPLTQRGDPLQTVTVIDSGTHWDAPNWGRNPLDDYGPDPFPPPIPAAWIDARNNTWAPGIPDVIADPLYALAGHGNFVAGVIAQDCPHADITIINHNGSFDPTSDDFPTEAAVARSLCLSAASAVIDLGFAFVAFQNTVSCAWDVAFRWIGNGVIGQGPVVVSPAGNQDSCVRRYPAALDTDPGGFQNMIGVASKDPQPPAEPFSNRGIWVTCSADGNDVHSTFLRVRNVRLEDALQPWWRFFPLLQQRFTFPAAWATWNGTSFAAPKVVAAIACEMARSGLPADLAWAAVQGTGTQDPWDQMGVILPF